MLRLELERTGSVAAYEANLQARLVLGASSEVSDNPPHDIRVALISVDNTTSSRTYDISFLTDLPHGGEGFDSSRVLSSSVYQWNTTTSLVANMERSNLTLFGSTSASSLEISLADAPLRGEYPVEYTAYESGEWELHI